MRVTVYVMAAIGVAFWFLGVALLQTWMIVFSAVLVSYCTFVLLTMPGGRYGPLDSESRD